jgi:magnesium transporter
MNKLVSAALVPFVTDLRHARAADIVDMLGRLAPAQASRELLRLPENQAIAVLDRPEFVTAPAVLAALPVQRAAAFVAAMSADRAADTLAGLAANTREQIFTFLEPEARASLAHLLSYDPNSAGGMMTTEFVSVPCTATVSATLEHIRHIERSRETVYSIYILEPQSETLIGTVSLRRLVTADAADSIMKLTNGRMPVTVGADASRDEAARLIRRHDLLAVPVVDTQNRILGIVTVDDVLDAIVETQTERAQRFGGVEALDHPYLDTGFLAMIRKRAGWLCALFLSEMLTATAMQHFEGELARAITLTLFIPLIMSSGGNSGSQATSLIIRALALGQVKLADWWRVALRELPTGLVLGAILGLVGIVRIAVWQQLGFYDYGAHWPLIALTVGSGLVGIVTFGSLAGSMLPFILQRLGFDPASASAPFVATLVDVTGLLIYFSIALVILNGTLL